MPHDLRVALKKKVHSSNLYTLNFDLCIVIISMYYIFLFILSLITAPLIYANTAWNYKGKTGPEYWSKLSPKFIDCRKGKTQSPINITGGVHLKQPELVFDYKNNASEIINDGVGLQIDSRKGSSLKIEEEEYQLIRTRIHTPSEHQISGKHARMEIQMFHANQEGEFALIVASMVQVGRPNNLLADLLADAPRKKGSNILKKPLNLLPLIHDQGQTGYYSYTGSLTIPPCSERIQWVVMKKPIYASSDQIKEFEKLMGKNNRPIQPINNRMITK